MEEEPGIRFLKIFVPVPDGSGKRGTTFQPLHESDLMKTRAAITWDAGAKPSKYQVMTINRFVLQGCGRVTWRVSDWCGILVNI
jgi:hypothetical protein